MKELSKNIVKSFEVLLIKDRLTKQDFRILKNLEINVARLIRNYIKNIDKPKCPKCKKSDFVIKRGKRYNRFGIIQKYNCNKCGYKFSVEPNRLRTPEYIRKYIFSLIDLNISTRKISKKVLEKYNYKISNISIARMLKQTKRYFGKDLKKEIVFKNKKKLIIK